MTYYKVLARGHRACHGGTYRYTPGRWTRRIENTVACERGWHVCSVNTIAQWLYAESDSLLPLEVWECEVENPTDAGDKFVCERIRLTRLVGTLDEYDLRWLATEFAISVLHNTDDQRIGRAINTVRAFCLGLADETDLTAAASAAGSAAGARSNAAGSAWSAASVASAASAAWSAASARSSAAWSAARSEQGRMVLDYLTEVAS